jgi:hypothetical protein
MSQDMFELNFLSADQFELKSMEGKVTRYTRAVPFTLNIAELQAYAGRYESDELMAVFELSAEKGLVARVNNRPGPPFPLTPVHQDIFQFAAVNLHFLRNKAGKVVGLEYSNPILRKVKFARLSNTTNVVRRQGKED